MTNRPDIWHPLKDHEISPPAEVCHRLRTILEIDDVAPDPAMGAFMERMQEHEVAPPAELEAIVGERCGVRTPEKRKRRGVRWYVAAAACVVLVVTGGIVMVKKEKPIAMSPAAPSVASKPLQTDTTNQKRAVIKDVAITAKPHSEAPIKVGRNPSFSIGGKTVQVSDNDLLMTFANYTYPEVPDYLLREGDQPLKIYVDQYTNIYVSKNMRALLKELYEVRNNGKPARKARKARRRLDDWKEKDEKRWDKSGKANPLDPVDLGEFIFK